MEIIETPIFTRIIQSLIPDELYRELQKTLVLRPDAGNVITGSGGVRKLRWSIPGKGKRGGIRVIYYWYKSQRKILMLYAYSKSQQEDLTTEQLKALRNLLEED
jgi:hypothetical protein